MVLCPSPGVAIAVTVPGGCHNEAAHSPLQPRWRVSTRSSRRTDCRIGLADFLERNRAQTDCRPSANRPRSS